MGSLISKKKKRGRERDVITDQDRAVLDLKNSRDRLKRYQTRLDADCVKLQEQAKAMVKEGRKDRALLLLKVKKLKQEQANKADSQLLSVLQLMDAIDWETQQLKVFDALKEGNVALNKLHEVMPLDKVEDLLADTAEAIAMEQEISKALGASWTDANEEDLLAELAGIEEEQHVKSSAAAAQAAAATLETERIPAVATKPLVPAAADSELAAEATPASAQEEAAALSLEDRLPEAPTTEPEPVFVPVIEAEPEANVESNRPTLVPA